MEDEKAKKKAMIEVLLFLSSEPLTPHTLKDTTGLSEPELVDLLDELVADHMERDGGVLIGKIAGGYQMYANPAYSDWARRHKGTARAQKLSAATLETLAIIAYKQPITKVEIEELRGVTNAEGPVKTLLDRRLINIVGRKEAPGKPLLYGTTRDFLQYFGLNELSELPTLKDMDREGAA